VLDAMLPHFDGLEVLRRVRAEAPNAPVLFLTARDAVEDRVAGLTAGGDDLIELTATEFELLRYLMRNPKRVLSKAQILDRVWNYDFGGQSNVVELYVSYLRKKIDAGRAPMIHTVRGAGYVLKHSRRT
jgi:two-component system OmpR family response regulator